MGLCIPFTMKTILIAILFTVSISHAGEYRDVAPGSAVKIPRDLYHQNGYRVQWWYFTGHLFDKAGREFGFELTFFSVNVQQKSFSSRFGVNNLYISHFSVTDVAEKRFLFHERIDSGAFGFAGAESEQLHVWVTENSLKGTLNGMYLKASGNNFSADLRLIPVKPIILNGEGGYSRKSEQSPLIASLYFSCPRLKTEGTLELNDTLYHVKGKSWFDREISTKSLAENQSGWDWFSIQLDDDTELMLYLLRNNDGSTDGFSSGTFIRADGTYRHLRRDDFKITVLSHFLSGQTGARYPSQWIIEIPSEHHRLLITPLLENQEIIAYRSTGNHYWEGTCSVGGTGTGRAYVEMTGY